LQFDFEGVCLLARLISKFDLFAAYARYSSEQKVALHKANAVDDFAAYVRKQVADGLADPIVIHGQRTQNMFEAMIVGFGGYRLLKQEDAGSVHPQKTFEIPDFRIILTNGEQLLIEVKNHYGKDPFKLDVKFRRDYLERMSAYSKLVGCQLRIAIYWSRWGFWTLVDPSDLKPYQNKLHITMTDAMRVSEMARLGDVTIGTKAPLQFRVIANRTKPRSITTTTVPRLGLSMIRWSQSARSC
jgi:hypothetical protein